MLNRRINSWRASIACPGFIRLSTFSRRSRSIAASSRTSRSRAFHFAYLPAPMPSASSAEATQTVMSVEVTRSMGSEKRVNGTSSFRVKVQHIAANQIVSSNARRRSHGRHQVCWVRDHLSLRKGEGRVRVGSIEGTLLAGIPHLHPLPSGKGRGGKM